MSGELIIGGIMVGSSVVFFVAVLCSVLGIPTVVEFFAGMFLLAAGLALVVYGLPFGAVAWGIKP